LPARPPRAKSAIKSCAQEPQLLVPPNLACVCPEPVLVKRSVSIARFEPGAAKGGVFSFSAPRRHGRHPRIGPRPAVARRRCWRHGTPAQRGRLRVADSRSCRHSQDTQPRQARDNQTMGKQLTQRKKKEAVRLSRTVSYRFSPPPHVVRRLLVISRLNCGPCAKRISLLNVSLRLSRACLAKTIICSIK
jgi:hypothetical protein